jgi:hypothetical protein
MGAAQLYDRDFFEWTRCNAALLRAGHLDQADVQHIAEELEDMGKGERRGLESRLEVLLQHLLKWKIQPNRRSASWRNTIELQRMKIAKRLEESPSLKPVLAANLEGVYLYGRKRAVGETGLLESSFPTSCPFTLAQILDPEFFPE